jgi:hypothetical protein
MKLLFVLVMSLSVHVTRKWRRASLLMRIYMALIVMKINHCIHLHHHPSLFLLPHLKQRLLRLLPLP